MTQVPSKAPAVSIKNLKIALPKSAERPYAVDGVSIDLIPGDWRHGASHHGWSHAASGGPQRLDVLLAEQF